MARVEVGSVIRQRQLDQIGPDRGKGGVYPTTPAAHQPPMLKAPDENAYNPSMSNLSGAASMPQVTAGGVVGTVSIQLLPANPRRGYLYIQNNSTANMLVAYDQNASPLSSIIIGPGGYYEPRVVPTNSISIASISLDDAAYAYVEGSR